jgi:tRNA nucleotidyltransferase/poly(A) polymerase
MKLETYSHIILILKKIIEGTKFDGHVFSVGGCERDRILGNKIKDIDIVVDLPNGGIEFANWLKDNGHTKGSVVVYEHYGTAMFCLKDAPDDAIEAVQTRK